MVSLRFSGNRVLGEQLAGRPASSRACPSNMPSLLPAFKHFPLASETIILPLTPSEQSDQDAISPLRLTKLLDAGLSLNVNLSSNDASSALLVVVLDRVACL